MERAVFIRRKIVADEEGETVWKAEGALLRGHLSNPDVIAVIILNSDLMLTVTIVKRLERFFSSIVHDKVTVVY